jgi:prepilin-type N-terminal cleavage/methylation domain-containing protein
MNAHYTRNKAFTLVELLVVISIIALLLSILIPTLGRARSAARLVICKANMKQVQTFATLFQADNDGYVPPVFNPSAPNVDAQGRYLSVAFRDYFPETETSKLLDKDFPPTGYPDSVIWSHANNTRELERYIEEVLPEFYMCPFVRGKDVSVPKYQGKISIGDTYYPHFTVGAFESYQVWLWNHKKGSDPAKYGDNHPLGEDHGKPAFGTIAWQNGTRRFQTSGGGLKFPWDGYIDNPQDFKVKWSSEISRAGVAKSFAEVATILCTAGQTDNWANQGGAIMNYGSHKNGGKGGTVLGMADGHVEWAEGTKVGWQ